MGKKLYVGSLPYSATEDQVRELFAPFGSLDSVRIIMDKFTGKSKGFAFVEFSSDDDATKAMDAVNGKDMDGRALVVNEARPEKPRTGGGGGFGGGRGGGGGGRGGFGGGRGGGGGGRGGYGGGGGGGRGGDGGGWNR